MSNNDNYNSTNPDSTEDTTTEDTTTEDTTEIHEIKEEAAVTQEAFLANAFIREFAQQFAEAEAKELDDQAFILSHREFDQWLVKMGLIKGDILDNDDIVLKRGISARRNEIRGTINQGAEFGKVVWPPYSIKILNFGVNLEVRIRTKHLEAIPQDFAKRMKSSLKNRFSHWDRLSHFFESERVKKEAPEQYINFKGVQRMLDNSLHSMVSQVDYVNKSLIAAYQDTQRFMATYNHQENAKRYYYQEGEEENKPEEDLKTEDQEKEKV